MQFSIFGRWQNFHRSAERCRVGILITITEKCTPACNVISYSYNVGWAIARINGGHFQFYGNGIVQFGKIQLFYNFHEYRIPTENR